MQKYNFYDRQDVDKFSKHTSYEFNQHIKEILSFKDKPDSLSNQEELTKLIESQTIQLTQQLKKHILIDIENKEKEILRLTEKVKELRGIDILLLEIEDFETAFKKIIS
jgi:hypothetical protein